MSCRTLRGTSTLASKNQLQSNAKLPKKFVSASRRCNEREATARLSIALTNQISFPKNKSAPPGFQRGALN